MKNAVSRTSKETAEERRQDTGTLAKLLEDHLIKHPRGSERTIEEIETYVVTETKFVGQTKKALKLLEMKERILVTVRKKRYTYPPRCRIAATRQPTISTFFGRANSGDLPGERLYHKE